LPAIGWLWAGRPALRPGWLPCGAAGPTHGRCL